jgi:hypothetical protein
MRSRWRLTIVETLLFVRPYHISLDRLRHDAGCRYISQLLDPDKVVPRLQERVAQLQKGRRKLTVRDLGARSDGVERIGIQFPGSTASVGGQVHLIGEVLVELRQLAIWGEANGCRDVLRWVVSSQVNRTVMPYRNPDVEDTNEPVRAAAAGFPTHLCAKVISYANAAIYLCIIHQAHDIVDHLALSLVSLRQTLQAIHQTLY